MTARLLDEMMPASKTIEEFWKLQHHIFPEWYLHHIARLMGVAEIFYKDLGDNLNRR